MSSSGCSRTHHIKVENLNEGEIKECSILLIKGHVQPTLCTPCSKPQQQQQLRATLNSLDQKSLPIAEEQLTQVAPTGQFKLLFDLAPAAGTPANPEAKYVLQLRYCNAELLLHFAYKERVSEYRLQPLYLLCADEDEYEYEHHGTTDAVLTDAAQASTTPTPTTPTTTTTATTTTPTQTSKLSLAERCTLIDLNLRLVQCIYAHKLRAAGYPNCTFTLNGPCVVFRAKQFTRATAYQCSEDELWQNFATEILGSDAWGQQLHLKFVGFVGCTHYDGAAVVASGDYSYVNIRRHLRAHAALGGGGLALFGSGHFYAWPRRFSEIGDCIRSAQRVDLARLPDDSNYRRTYGGVYASTLGAVCHELGHCFDLGHTDDGVMGNGFDYLNRVLTVDTCTEQLPNRIINNSKGAAAAATSATKSTTQRFTKLKPLKQRARNNFLEKYHEQRRNESFYFTRNCAIILAQHKWLRSATSHAAIAAASQDATQPVKIVLEPSTAEIISSAPLRLIELRCNINSLVAHYEEIQADSGGSNTQYNRVDSNAGASGSSASYRFQLPQPLWDLVATECSHYIFVLTSTGETKRLTCDKLK